jgi:hypothetical protein
MHHAPPWTLSAPGRLGRAPRATAPYYTDNLIHDLKTERFFKPTMINGMNEVGDGAVKAFPPRHQGFSRASTIFFRLPPAGNAGR